MQVRLSQVYSSSFNSAKILLLAVLACVSACGTKDYPPASSTGDRGDQTTSKRQYGSESQLYEMAKRAERSGKSERAEDLYRRAVQVSPRSTKSSTELGMFLLGEGRYREAQPHLLAAWRRNPRSPSAQYNLGLNELHLGKYTDAVSHFEGAVRSGKGDGDTYSNLGLAYLRSGQRARAEAIWKQAAQRGANSAALYTNLALLHYEAGSLKGARQYINQAFRMPKPGPESYNARALITLAEGNLAGALKDWQSAIEAFRSVRQGMSSSSSKGFGFVRDLRGTAPQPKVATIIGLRTADLSGPAKEAEVALNKKDYRAAEKYLSELVESNPNDTEVKSLLAFSLLEQRKFQQAKNLLSDLAKLENPSSVTLYNYSLLQLRQGESDEAIARLEQAVISAHSKDAQIWELYGYALEEKGEMQLAERAYTKALQFQQSLVMARNNRAAILLLSGDAKRASEEFARIASDSTTTRFNYGLSLLETKNYTQAKQQFLKVVAQQPKDVDSLINLGFIYGNDGDYQQAKGYLDKALALDDDSTLALNNLGVVAYQQGKFEEAEDYLEKAQKVGTTNSAVMKNLAAIALRKDNRAQAKEFLQRAVELNPTDFSARRDLGHLALVLKEPDLALENLQVAVGLEPQNPDVLFNLAVAYQMSNQRTEAIKLYEQFIDVAGKRMELYDQTVQAERAIRSLRYPR